MEGHSQLIDELGGPAALADGMNENLWTVRKWKTRGRIPARAWPKVIEFAKQKGKRVSADSLLRTHAA